MLIYNFLLVPIFIAITYYSYTKIKTSDFYTFIFLIALNVNIIYPVYLYKMVTDGYKDVNYNTKIYDPMSVKEFIQFFNNKE